MNDKEMNTAQFTQKDLMQHLLNVTQHAATREELDDRFNRLDVKMDIMRKDISANTWRLLGGLAVIMSLFSYLTKTLN